MPGGFPLGIEVYNGTTIGLASGKGTAITSGNNVYSAYTQLVASTTADTSWIMLQVMGDASANAGGTGDFAKFAIGAALSEKDFATDLTCPPLDSILDSQVYVLPIVIPSGTRISGAAINSAASADVLLLSATLFDGGMPMIEGCAGVEALNGRTNTNPTSGNPAGTFGTYTQYVGSTTRDYLGLLIAGTFTSGSSNPAEVCIVDIGVGASTAEKNIVSSMPFGSIGGGAINSGSLFVPVPIPASTRVSMRCSTSINASSTGLSLTLYGIFQ